MIPVTVLGHTYKSISEARRELNSPVPEITIRWRLRNGWPANQAFTMGAIPPVLRRTARANMQNI